MRLKVRDLLKLISELPDGTSLTRARLLADQALSVFDDELAEARKPTFYKAEPRDPDAVFKLSNDVD